MRRGEGTWGHGSGGDSSARAVGSMVGGLGATWDSLSDRAGGEKLNRR